MLKKSVTLDSYSILISKIWELRNKKTTLEESLKLAIKYCMDNNVLKDFLRKHGSEVFCMLYGEYNIEDEIAVAKREAREDGYAEGHSEAWEKSSKHEKLTIARNLLIEGSTPDFVQKITGLDLETIQGLQN